MGMFSTFEHLIMDQSRNIQMLITSRKVLHRFTPMPDVHLSRKRTRKYAMFEICQLQTMVRFDGKGLKMMESLKQEAINAIAKLPDSADIDEIMYRLYVIDKVRKDEDAIKSGDYATVEELKIYRA